MFFKGLKFGLLLQFAVGPICLLVFNTAGSQGFAASSLAALAVTMVDGFYILLAGFGLAAFMQHNKIKNIIQLFGALVLIVFGLDIAMGTLGLSFLPGISLFQAGEKGGVFFKAAIMTASNPLTIIFWGGVLSATVTSDNISPNQLLPFGLGCICATFVFLNGVGLIGTLAGAFLPPAFLKALSIGVGAVIIYFGLRMSMVVYLKQN